MNISGALLWGLVATSVLTIVQTTSQELGWSRISLPFMLGTMVTPRRAWALAVGFVAHFALGIGFALLYAWLFESINQSAWWLGLILGGLHASFMLVVVMTLLPGIHPRMAGRHHGPTPTRQLEPPGFLGMNYGRRTPLITGAAHLAYGVILGALYVPTS